MPYIPTEKRLGTVPVPETPGELNYLICRIVQSFMETHEHNYTTLNAAIGAVECAKLELYRRLVVPYEDAAILKNGDVFS